MNFCFHLQTRSLYSYFFILRLKIHKYSMPATNKGNFVRYTCASTCLKKVLKYIHDPTYVNVDIWEMQKTLSHICCIRSLIFVFFNNDGLLMIFSKIYILRKYLNSILKYSHLCPNLFNYVVMMIFVFRNFSFVHFLFYTITW